MHRSVLFCTAATKNAPPVELIPRFYYYLLCNTKIGSRKIPDFSYFIRLLGHFEEIFKMPIFMPCYTVFRRVLRNLLRGWQSAGVKLGLPQRILLQVLRPFVLRSPDIRAMVLALPPLSKSFELLLKCTHIVLLTIRTATHLCNSITICNHNINISYHL